MITDKERFDEAGEMEPVDYWVKLTCPICGNDCFGGLGRDSDGRYIHYCPDCDTEIHTPNRVDGQLVGTK
jgi:hypothetical protein